MNDFLMELVKVVGAIFAPVIAGLITALLVQWLRKMGLTLSAEKQAKLEHFVRQAILAAEEWAATEKKAHRIVTSSMKLERAVDDVADATNVTLEKAEKLVQAELPKAGLGASAPLAPVLLTPSA